MNAKFRFRQCRSKWLPKYMYEVYHADIVGTDGHPTAVLGWVERDHKTDNWTAKVCGEYDNTIVGQFATRGDAAEAIKAAFLASA